MANKDGIVSIGFDYKKELDEVCAAIEKELNNLGGDINLSDGIKKQMAEIKKMITDMKKDIGSSFDKITETKLDTKIFESFKKDVNKRIREVSKEVAILKEQFSALDGSANVNGIVQQFANLKKYVEDSNASISEFISNSEKLGKSVVISSTLNTDELRNDVLEIKKLLTDLNKEDLDFGYTNKSAKELSNDLEGLVDKYYRITDLIDEMKSSMSGLDITTQEYKNQEVQLSKLSLELLKCSAQMDDLFGAKNAEKINVDKIISVDELDDIFAHVKDISSKIKLEAKNIVESIELSNTAVKNIGNDTTSDLSNKSNIELHISTKQSTINKQLDEMIDNLQQRAASKPIIAPVKLRVDSEYEKTTKDASDSALTKNQINEARKDIDSVVPGLEKAFNNSMRIATNKAVETAKESIKAVREFFESNPIIVHLTVPDDEKVKIGKAILSEDGKTTINISGEVDKARKSVKGLSADLEKSQLLIKENAQNAKNLSLEKLVNSLSETMAQFSELKGIIASIQNMENTIARASGISSTNELVEQWSIVEKTIINATKLDGDFRKNANIGKIISEYQKYIDMGGTNTLFSIDKIKNNEATIDSILSKIKELKSQNIENDSIQKLSVDLDGVIAKFNELISTVKTATNALYKIIRQGSVSDLDKQWSSISNKFKSIADETGKINLGKQKTNIKELMDMYQKYTNAGGTNSLMSLTDNVETLRKLDKEYQKLNQTQTVDNSSTIEKESESFKNIKKSVDSLTTAIGETKVQAINIEATAMEDAAEREIMAIRSILDNLDLIVSRLKDIKGIKLPKIEVENAGVVEKAVESLSNAGNKSNISSENPTVEVSQNDEVTASIRKKKEELASYELQLEETRYEIEKLSKAENESFGFNRSHTKKEQISSLRDSVTRNIFGKPDNGGRSGQKKWFALGDISNIDSSVLKSYQMWNEELSKAGYKLSEIRAIGKDGLEADIIPIDGKAITNAEEFRKALDNITTAPSENVELLNKQVSELESKISSLKAEIASLQSNQNSPMKDVFQGSDKSTTDASATAIKEESKALEQVSNSAKEASESKEKFAKANKEVKASADSSKASISEEEKYFNSLGKSLGQYQNTLTSISRKPADGNRSKDLQDRIDIISSSLENLRTLHAKAGTEGYIFNKEDVERGKELEKVIQNNIEAVSKMSAAQKGSTEAARWKEIDKISKYLDKNTRLSKKAKEQLREYIALLKSGSAKNIEEIHMAFLKVAESERIAGREGKSFLDIFNNKVLHRVASQLAIYYLSFYDFIRYGRKVVENIKEVDTALTELRKVSDATEQRLTTNFKNSAKTAKELGATISDVISATADWSRMGYNIDQSEELARISTLYKNVGDGIDIEEANNSLISTLQGFQLDVSEAESIIDKFNEVANNYAIDSAGIGEALQRSAASFNAANTDLSKSIALITATRLKKLVEYMETYIKNIFNCHRSLYYHAPQYRGNYYMTV